MGFNGWNQSVISTDRIALASFSTYAENAKILDGVLVGQSTGTAKNKWYKVCSLYKPNASYENYYITFLAQKTYGGSNKAGILRIDIRMSLSAGVVETNSTHAYWFGLSGITSSVCNLFALNYDNAGNVALFVKIEYGWEGWDFTVLTRGWRTGRADENHSYSDFTLYNTGFTDGGYGDTLPYENTIYSILG